MAAGEVSSSSSSTAAPSSSSSSTAAGHGVAAANTLEDKLKSNSLLNYLREKANKKLMTKKGRLEAKAAKKALLKKEKVMRGFGGGSLLPSLIVSFCSFTIIEGKKEEEEREEAEASSRGRRKLSRHDDSGTRGSGLCREDR